MTGVPLKVQLVVHQFLPEHASGTEILTYKSALELRRRGHEVAVFTGLPVHGPLADEERFDSYVHDGLPVDRFRHEFVPMGGQANLVQMEYDLQLTARRFRERLRAFRPDVVHFFHLARLTSSLIPVCRELGIPAFLTPTDFHVVCPTCQLRLPGERPCAGPDEGSVNCIRHLIGLHGARSGLARLLARGPEALTTALIKAVCAGWGGRHPAAEMVRAAARRKQVMVERANLLEALFVPTRLMRSVLERHGVESARLRDCAYGLDLEDFQGLPRAAAAEGSLRLGYIGTLAEHKGVHLLLEAVRALPGERLQLLVYGREQDFPRYAERLRAQARGDSRISFAGTFPNREIGRVLAGIDALVVPSLWYENTPLVVFSAQAARTPVIATDLQGLAEAVRHEENGLLFPVGDAAALRAAIQRVSRDRQLLSRLAAACRPPRPMVEYVDEIEEGYRSASSFPRRDLPLVEKTKERSADA